MKSTPVTYELDAGGIIRLFGGRQRLPALFCKHGFEPVTIAQVDKWRNRRSIPGDAIVALTVISRAEGIDFDITAHVIKQETKREPLALPQPAA